MKRILVALLAGCLVSFFAFAAEGPGGALNLKNMDVQLVLPLYQDLSGLRLVVSSEVKKLHVLITIEPSKPLSKNETLNLIEKTLVEKGVVVTRLDDKRVSVTFNDALLGQH